MRLALSGTELRIDLLVQGNNFVTATDTFQEFVDAGESELSVCEEASTDDAIVAALRGSAEVATDDESDGEDDVDPTPEPDFPCKDALEYLAKVKTYTFASGGPDNIKQWKCPDGKFIQNLSGHNAIVNCLGMNDDGVLVSGDDSSDTIDQTSDIVDDACETLLAEVLERQGVTEGISFPDFRDADSDVQTSPDMSDEAIVASVVEVSPNDSDEDDMESDNTGDPGPTVAEAAHCVSVMRVFAEKRGLAEKLARSIRDNGTLFFWDWRTGYNFQRLQAPVQPGSIDSEAGIFACGFDQSGSRLITAEADKTVKIFREDDTAHSTSLNQRCSQGSAVSSSCSATLQRVYL
ncbi:hypothetical protein HPB50_007071 [Hyalomma asiaticum]|uniref:Uncharacterized protein n=1 Tax=Hyalomma asiaticum TaxID=266040 RepID=A0ACB7SLQ9_HYAAI|nr:hypothetical protein HPB50_007071 [Hyalomma asiaticum]